MFFELLISCLTMCIRHPHSNLDPPRNTNFIRFPPIRIASVTVPEYAADSPGQAVTTDATFAGSPLCIDSQQAAAVTSTFAPGLDKHRAKPRTHASGSTNDKNLAHIFTPSFLVRLVLGKLTQNSVFKNIKMHPYLVLNFYYIQFIERLMFL